MIVKVPSKSLGGVLLGLELVESTFEIVFHVGEDALKMMSPHVQCDEISLLHVFDVNRVQIESVADNAYSRRR